MRWLCSGILVRLFVLVVLNSRGSVYLGGVVETLGS